MNDTLSKIENRIVELLAVIEKYNLEIEELRTAKRVLMKLNGIESEQMEPTLFYNEDQKPSFFRKKSDEVRRVAVRNYLKELKSRPNTTKDAILQALIENPDPWMIASDIQEAASRLKGVEVPMSSVSPTLTALKDEGLIVRDGQKVAYVKRAEGWDLV